MSPRAVVIGGGVGGLAAAIRLRQRGLAVTLFERADVVGGKLGAIDLGDGLRLPSGPTVLTMRWVFDELFGDGGLGAAVELVPLEPLCRHFWPDGSRLDLHHDRDASYAAIRAFAGARDADGYLRFCAHAARIYETVKGPFMERPVPPWIEFLRPKILFAFPRIDALRTLWQALGSFFGDARLRQLFARYATYNGSSPFLAPATLAVIAHVENAGGVWGVRGGIWRVAEALATRARALGVELVTNAEVAALDLADGRVRGVRLADGAQHDAELVFANCDAAQLYALVGKSADDAAARYHQQPRSLSACLSVGVGTPPVDLAYHSVFFSQDYAAEFAQLVDERRLPDSPTVYVCAEDRLGGARPTAPERLYLLTNAPPLDGDAARDDAALARRHLGDQLARFGWPLQLTHERTLTPTDFAARFPGSRGALYGLASNSKFAAFKRPTNHVDGVAGLWAVGGSVHPGAGLPMVCLSARIAVAAALAS